MPQPGPMREHVTIQTGTAAVDSEGQPVVTWSTFAIVWASVLFTTGTEASGETTQLAANIRADFLVRYRTDIAEAAQAEKLRLSWRSFIWDIRAVLPFPRKDYMTIRAARVE